MENMDFQENRKRDRNSENSLAAGEAGHHLQALITVNRWPIGVKVCHRDNTK